MNAPLLRQTWVVLAVYMNMIDQGMVTAYTSCLLPALQQSDSPIRVDLHTASWLASICGLANIPGFQLSSILMNKYGRRLGHILIGIPGIIGWFIVFFAQNIPTLMVGRFLGGISGGASISLGAIVIGEYTDPKHRGMFLNFKTATVNLGSIFVHIFGHFLSWRQIALLGILPHLISLLITFTWPESPPWLASKGKFIKSRKSFFWLRGNTEMANNEIEKLIKTQRERLLKINAKKAIHEKIKRSLAKCKRMDFLKPLFIMMISCILFEATGRHFYPAYALQIIGELADNKSQSFYYTLGMDIIIIVSALCSSILVKIMRKRVLLFSTGFSACAILMIACIYLSLAANEIIQKSESFISIGLLVMYFILVNLGCSPIPLALLGEVFPLPHRGAGSAVTGTVLSLSFMIALQITPYLLINIKVYGMFLVFDIIMCSTLVILYFILPETKDKTLQEIEEFFNQGKYKNNEEDDNDVNMNILKL